MIESQNELYELWYARKCNSHADFGVSMNVLVWSEEREKFEVSKVNFVIRATTL